MLIISISSPDFPPQIPPGSPHPQAAIAREFGVIPARPRRNPLAVLDCIAPAANGHRGGARFGSVQGASRTSTNVMGGGLEKLLLREGKR